jgi:ABC-type transport system substrate-binding protein
MAIGTSPSPVGVRQTWSSAAIALANGYNIGRYSDKVVDAQIDSAIASTTKDAARAHYRAAYQQIIDDAPAVWLFEPVVIAAANRRIELPRLRSDAWWTSIPGWQLQPPGTAKH